MKYGINMNLKFDYIIHASHLNSSIQYLKLNRSLEEKDKLMDELLIRRLMYLRDNLFVNGAKGLASYVDNGDWEVELDAENKK